MRLIFRSKKGFTLVEVIVVLVILAILAAILIPSMVGWIDEANSKQANLEIRQVALAAKTAYTEVYAKYNLKTTDQVLYLKSKPSTAPANKEFIATVKNLLTSDTVFANISKITVADSKTLYVVYIKDNVKYMYSEANGTVTIAKV